MKNLSYRERLKSCLLLIAGALLTAQSALADPDASMSPAEKYQAGVECLGYFDFGLSMMPADSEQRPIVLTNRAAWLDYVNDAKSNTQRARDADIAKVRDKITGLAMSGDRAAIASYITPIQKRCDVPPPDPSAPSPANPFGLEDPSDFKTYVAAMQCAGKFVVGDEAGIDGPTTQGFIAMARNAKPNVPEETFEDDLAAATAKWISVLSTTDLDEFAALESQCDTAKPFLE